MCDGNSISENVAVVGLEEEEVAEEGDDDEAEDDEADDDE
jgi:hypothetical protein